MRALLTRRCCTSEQQMRLDATSPLWCIRSGNKCIWFRCDLDFWPLTSDLANLSSNFHSHNEYLWQVSSKSLHCVQTHRVRRNSSDNGQTSTRKHNAYCWQRRHKNVTCKNVKKIIVCAVRCITTAVWQDMMIVWPMKEQAPASINTSSGVTGGGSAQGDTG